MLTTIHGFGDRRILPAYQRSTSAFVSISDADRAPELDYVATVHHGIDVSGWPVDSCRATTLVALRADPPGQGHRRRDRDRPAGRPPADHLRSGARRDVLRRAGGAARRRRRRCATSATSAARNGPQVLGQAAALLHPSGFDEPFGLSVVEAMACGTPVVGYRRGALPRPSTRG